MSLESVRNFVGHDSLDTTSIYATAELGRQYREAEAFLRQAQPTPRAVAEPARSVAEPGGRVGEGAMSGNAARIAAVHVRVRIAQMPGLGRGRSRVLKIVDNEVLDRYQRTRTHDGVTTLQVPYRDVDALDRTVDDLLVDIAIAADAHGCSSESEAWAEVDGVRWTW